MCGAVGARGVSLLFASGDDGAASEYARENNTYCEPFNPGFPSASPYVTTVGGTQLSRTNLPVAGMCLCVSCVRGSLGVHVSVDACVWWYCGNGRWVIVPLRVSWFSLDSIPFRCLLSGFFWGGGGSGRHVAGGHR